MIDKTKLIIWDFDGVISDTEHLWIENWNQLLKKYFNIGWNFETANKYLGGISVEGKIANLQKLGIDINPEFMAEIREINFAAIDSIEPIADVEKIIELEEFAHCIATGGSYEKTSRKLDVLGFNQYFSRSNIFTAKEVKNGKPEPDLFWYAADKMGYRRNQCIVIEDSMAGLEAGLKAGILTVAFLGCEMNNNSDNIKRVKDLGIENIFFDMISLKKFLQSL